MTGNGKCNLTNMDMDSCHYITADAEDASFVKRVLELYPPQKLLDFFHSIGLRTTVLRETYIYPETEAAASVVNVFYESLTDWAFRFIPMNRSSGYPIKKDIRRLLRIKRNIMPMPSF